MKRLTFILAFCLFVILRCDLAASAVTYYIDFTNGDNTADGLSAQTAWKHAPGDPQAEDLPASVTLAAGDTVLFKGGVTYHGAIQLTVSGEPNRRITFDGNISGTFGDGPAILDGGRVITNWQRCATAADAEGNPRWQDIFYADIDLDISANFNHGKVVNHRQVPRDKMAPWQRVIMYDGDQKLLPISQYPKPSDPFYPDLVRDYLISPNRLEVREDQDVSIITDQTNLVQTDPDYYRDMFVGVHGGNNHVYFATVKKFDPAANQLYFARFEPSTYNVTRYAFYNSVRLIENPGEWAVKPLPGGKSRFYLLADRLANGKPDNIGFPELETGVTISKGASHIAIKGFLIQRYSGGGGGVDIRSNNPRSKDITISDCEIRFISGHAGIGPHFADEILVDNCYIHHCPSWTTGIFLNRVNNYTIRNCRLDKNSGSGIRHYESKHGRIHDNAILNHYGTHSSTINVYEGCEDVAIERNYMHNTMTINRNASNIVFRNNVLDSQDKCAVNVGMWVTGRTGGREIDNILFENNTFINTSRSQNYSTSILFQSGRGAKLATGVVIRNNIFDRLRSPAPATAEGNIFMRNTEQGVAGQDSQVVSDPTILFIDPARGDYRRKPAGPKMDAGANIPPPPAVWHRNLP